MPRLAGFLILLLALPAQAEFKYKTPDKIGAELRALAGQESARMQVLAKTPGGREVWLLSLGKQEPELPAVMVIANMEGNSPLATEAALELSRQLLSGWKEDLKTRRWYILPVGNPDGYANFFKKPLFERHTNDRPFNDDYDDRTDEDGPEDLNQDGFITLMRQAHPEGEWMAVEKNPVLMKKADPGKGERGIYRIFTEGIDNDRDGLYNEDGPGGTNPGRNFPHKFTHYTKTDGPWAASEPSSRAVLEFAYAHPEIGMLIVFGRSNNIKKPGEAKTGGGQEKYKLPERMAKKAGLDPSIEYPLEDVMQMVREYTGWMQMPESVVLSMLGVGAKAEPDHRDLPYLAEAGRRYGEFIKKAGRDRERLDPPGYPPGSVDEWAYYQFGVPVFSLDFWSLPKKKEEKKEEAKKEEEKEKKPDAYAVDQAEQALYQVNPGAFVAWKPYRHPALGKVEIGGRIPWAHLRPPPAEVKGLIESQLPFVRELAGMLPVIEVSKVEVEPRGPGVWKLEAWVANRGFLPYPTHQGERCRRPVPVVVTLEGGVLLEGKKRMVLKLLPGSGGAGKAVWVLKAKAGSRVTVVVRGFAAGSDRKVVVLKGGGR